MHAFTCGSTVEALVKRLIAETDFFNNICHSSAPSRPCIVFLGELRQQVAGELHHCKSFP